MLKLELSFNRCLFFLPLSVLIKKKNLKLFLFSFFLMFSVWYGSKLKLGSYLDLFRAQATLSTLSTCFLCACLHLYRLHSLPLLFFFFWTTCKYRVPEIALVIVLMLESVFSIRIMHIVRSKIDENVMSLSSWW